MTRFINFVVKAHLILDQVELLEHIYIQQFKIDERKMKLLDDTANV